MTPREKLEDHPKKINEADIKFEGVSFTYPGSEHEALKDINVTIKQGEKVAIVGENGSGKSTFINLLVGMYEPDLGSISVSGKNVKDNLLSVRRAVSVVFQNFGQYESQSDKT